MNPGIHDRELFCFLRYLRSRAGLSLRKAAKEIGISNSHLSNIEQGRRRCTHSFPMANMIRAYGLTEGEASHAVGLWLLVRTHTRAPYPSLVVIEVCNGVARVARCPENVRVRIVNR